MWNKIDTYIEGWGPMALNFPPRSSTFHTALLQCCHTFSGSECHPEIDFGIHLRASVPINISKGLQSWTEKNIRRNVWKF